ncbi:polysaccharide biosynthesis/export family protein [Pseudomonas sp. dw_358]|uniref:polysaccharide biosynthesis/export family protein n=1 Tax=Pseudomonas sp. dw_358 TaxID=2720083 RepID=UPI001BD4EFC6|nr:polysaccharide biosynthesis/export family protein [Pseudomonas sp. dw_358]
MTVKNVVFALLFLVSGSVFAATVDDGYRLGSGDVLSINVYGEEGLTFKEIPVNDAGVLSFPMIGNVQAKGHTTAEVTDEMVKRLKNGYLNDPQVSVSVVTYRPFFINGEVKKPGGYPYQPGLRVSGAISLGEGLTERGSDSRITVIRASDPTHKEEKAKLDDPVAPGDTINVQQGFF